MDCWLCEWVGDFGLGDWKEDTDDLMWRNGQVCDLGFRRQDIRYSQWMGMEWAGMGWTQSQKKEGKKILVWEEVAGRRGILPE